MGTQLSPSQKGGRPPIFGPCLLWPNGWVDQDDTWHGGGPRSRPHCARWRPAPVPQKGTEAPFSAHVYCGQTAGWIKVPLGTAIGLDPGHIMLDGDPAPSPQKWGSAPQFSAYVYCGQAAGWIKMPLDTEVGLGPGHIVRFSPHKKGQSPPPNFRWRPLLNAALADTYY